MIDQGKVIESKYFTFDDREIPSIDSDMKESLKFEIVIQTDGSEEENEENDEIMQAKESVQEQSLKNNETLESKTPHVISTNKSINSGAILKTPTCKQFWMKPHPSNVKNCILENGIEITPWIKLLVILEMV